METGLVGKRARKFEQLATESKKEKRKSQVKNKQLK